VTTPAPPQQPGQPPPQQQQDDGLDDAALAVAVAALLAGSAAFAVAGGAAAILTALRKRFALSSAASQALGSVLTMVTAYPPPLTGIIGAASAQTARMNAARRAQYVIAASKRVLGAAREARAKGEPVGAAVRAQLERERKFYTMHQQAMWNRATAAGRIDMEAAVHGNLLGWNAVHSKTTTPDCRKADGRNFYVDPPPYIGLPGIGPHNGCRCYPSAPHRGGKLLPGPGPLYARAA